MKNQVVQKSIKWFHKTSKDYKMMAFKARSIFTTWIRKSEWMGSQNKNWDSFDQCFFTNNSNPTISNNNFIQWPQLGPFSQNPNLRSRGSWRQASTWKTRCQNTACVWTKQGLAAWGYFWPWQKNNQPKSTWKRHSKNVSLMTMMKTHHQHHDKQNFVFTFYFECPSCCSSFFWSPWNLRNLRPSPGEEAVCLPPYHIRAWHPWQPVTQPWQDIRAPWHPKRIRASMMEDVLCLFVTSWKQFSMFESSFLTSSLWCLPLWMADICYCYYDVI